VGSIVYLIEITRSMGFGLIQKSSTNKRMFLRTLPQEFISLEIQVLKYEEFTKCFYNRHLLNVSFLRIEKSVSSQQLRGLLNAHSWLKARF
jgi:hypothetical protein